MEYDYEEMIEKRFFFVGMIQVKNENYNLHLIDSSLSVLAFGLCFHLEWPSHPDFPESSFWLAAIALISRDVEHVSIHGRFTMIVEIQ